MSDQTIKPLLVTGGTARRILGIGNTKYWALVKKGLIKTVELDGSHPMVVYASLETLTQGDKK